MNFVMRDKAWQAEEAVGASKIQMAAPPCYALHMSQQQDQALSYFSRFAADWRKKASGGYEHKFNVIAARNAYVEGTARSMKPLPRVLDVGCGTGELARALAKAGLQATGIDFAPDMVKICKELAIKEKVNATFLHASFFDHDFMEASFDLISALGFIEYISQQQLDETIKRSKKILSKRGSLILGSRNRLFNIASMNAYTTLERELGAADTLLQEAITIAEAKTTEETIALLRPLKPSLPRASEHPHHDIQVQTRHQYTPAELVAILENAGYVTTDIYPVHYHGVPPSFKEEHPDIHTQIANLMQEHAGTMPALIPFSSTFLIHARLA